MIDQAPTASILALLTCRPHFHPTWHHRSYLTEITVNRLARHQIERMTTHVGGENVTAEVMQQLIQRTDGVPLFVEEMTKAMLESGHLKEGEGQYALTGPLRPMAIPATLHDSLMARLIVWSRRKRSPNMPPSLGVSFPMICSRRSHK